MIQHNEQTGASEISAYTGQVLDARTAIQEVAKIKQAFPSTTPQFTDILIERAIAKGFTAQKLTDAVNHVIDTCQYPNPTLANFLSFDKRIKVFTYNDLVDLVSSSRGSFEDFHRYELNGKPIYIRNVDKEIYQMPDTLL